MSKIIFRVSYKIKEEKINDFRTLAAKLRTEFGNLGVNYGIYNVQGHELEFEEIFICESQEEYDQLEDQSNDTVQLLVDKLARCVNGKMQYTTLHEVA